MQFRSASGRNALAPAYEMRFSAVTMSAQDSRAEELRTDANTIYLSPVRLAPDNVFPIEGRVLTLTREEEAQAESQAN